MPGLKAYDHFKRKSKTPLGMIYNRDFLPIWSSKDRFPNLNSSGSSGSSLWLLVISVTSSCTSVQCSIQFSNFQLLFTSVTSGAALLLVPPHYSLLSLVSFSLTELNGSEWSVIAARVFLSRDRWLSDIERSKRLQDAQRMTYLWFSGTCAGTKAPSWRHP